jgi:H+-transporting ATPase
LTHTVLLAQAVLKHCHNKQALEKAVTDKVNDLASRGYRALGVALAEGEGAATAPGTKWEYVGLVPLFDPPRHDTKATIER